MFTAANMGGRTLELAFQCTHEGLQVHVSVFIFPVQFLQSTEKVLLRRWPVSHIILLAGDCRVLLICGLPKQVQDEIGVHRFQASVLLSDHRIGDVEFKALQAEGLSDLCSRGGGPIRTP